MKNLRLIFVLVVISVLMGCACFTGDKPQSAIDQKREINFDKRLLKSCDNLPILTTAREEDIYEWSKQVIKMYSDCATWKLEEDIEVKKAFNIKD